MKTNVAFGSFGERHVARYLTSRGYSILERNYRSPWGEIDIIAQKGLLIAFVEVKTRLRETVQHGLLVLPIKQQRIIRTALFYCFDNGVENKNYRFDMAFVQFPDGRNDEPAIEYIENAFSSEDMFP